LSPIQLSGHPAEQYLPSRLENDQLSTRKAKKKKKREREKREHQGQHEKKIQNEGEDKSSFTAAGLSIVGVPPRS
jgi:hypothetical protein